MVKIRKGTTCRLILESRTLPGVVKIFKEYIQVINHKSSVRDPNYLKIGIKCGEIEQYCEMIYPNKQALPPSMKSLPENKFTKLLLVEKVLIYLYKEELNKKISIVMLCYLVLVL